MRARNALLGRGPVRRGMSSSIGLAAVLLDARVCRKEFSVGRLRFGSALPAAVWRADMVARLASTSPSASG